MMSYLTNPTKVKSSTSNDILPRYGTAKIRLTKKDDSEKPILKLQNIFYLPNGFSNLFNLGLLNNASIYHYKKNQTLYNKVFQKPRIFI